MESTAEQAEASVFVIDASSLIQAHRNYYAFDICPGFWDAIENHHSNSKVESIDRVREEVEDGEHYDELKSWVQDDLPDEFFVSTKDDADIATAFGEINQWVQNNTQFLDEAKAEFAADKVDGWLIAYALVKKRVVVTQEIYAPDIRKRVPIPNVCEAFNVEYIDTFQLLRELGVELTI